MIIANQIEFSHCQFYKGILFKSCIFDKSITFDSITSDNFLCSKTTFKDNFKLYNYKKNDSHVKFQNSNIKFFNVTFVNIIIFQSNKINNLKFYSYHFYKYSIMNNNNINLIDLENSNFNEGCNPLNLFNYENNMIGNENIKNRETARIIKDSFEQQNNIMEANKYYALEMKEREKELNQDRKEGKNLLEWLVFKVYGLASNHSQDWLLSLFWILSFSFGYGFINCIN